jgi:hypothetical protein
MVQLKNGVTGFIYDSIYGCVKTIFTKPINNELMFISEDDVLFIDNETINSMLEFDSKEALENDSEGLNEVLEWVE